MSLKIAAMVLAGAALAATASAQDLANMGVPEFATAPAQPEPAADETPAPAADEATTEKERKAQAKKDKAAKKAAAKKDG